MGNRLATDVAGFVTAIEAGDLTAIDLLLDWLSDHSDNFDRRHQYLRFNELVGLLQVQEHESPAGLFREFKRNLRALFWSDLVTIGQLAADLATALHNEERSLRRNRMTRQADGSFTLTDTAVETEQSVADLLDLVQPPFYAIADQCRGVDHIVVASRTMPDGSVRSERSVVPAHLDREWVFFLNRQTWNLEGWQFGDGDVEEARAKAGVWAGCEQPLYFRRPNGYIGEEGPIY